ncbi:hypothetical protein [uncultured Mucilaginibacter sp.]|uniref:hypothetical protein n=1 Tax=uncultured Mucilaginibacter sp. TaxID=797541 RepID=UPI0026015F25|nr:hypothetical protein [uncultured Mucilaginibacter sp.]
MKKFLLLTLTIVASGFSANVFAQASDATVTKVTITFNTHNDNKDHDTQLNVSIKTKVNLFLSKDIATGNNLGGDMEFVDPSTHSFDLVLRSDNIKVSDLQLPIIDIDVQPNGNDRWIFDYVVQLTFSDGNTYSSKSQGVILDQDNKHYEGVFSN